MNGVRREPSACLLALAVIAWSAHAAWAVPPAAAAPGPGQATTAPQRTPVSRAQMESAADPSRTHFVWGTRESGMAPLLHERALLMARRMFGADSARVLADRDARESDLAGGAVVLLGGPRQNSWTARLAGGLPVEFTPSGFRWRGTAYERPGDLLSLAYPNPLAPDRFLYLVVPNSAAALGRHAGFLMGGDDWRIVRDGEVVRSGSFAQSAAAPWTYEPALDRDLEAGRARWRDSLASRGDAELVVRAPPGMARAAAAFSGGRAVLARMDTMGLRVPRAGPVTLTLYRSIEEKGALVRDTRPEQLAADGTAHAAQVTGRDEPDFACVAEARLALLGGDPVSRFMAGAGAWISGRFQGEPLERSVARLYDGRLLPSAGDAATRPSRWRSPLVTTPARALLAAAIWECAPRAGRRAALLALLRPDPPGAFDSLCAAVGVPVARVAARYRAIGNLMAFSGRRSLALGRVTAWRPADGFMAGVCLAHDVRLERGYASAACARTLRELRDGGAGWISITPFGYVPEGSADLWPSAEGGPDEENDEALCEAAARAHALGLRVWLVPHVWSRSWPGSLALPPAGWRSFLDAYREFALHYALLADRERIEGFSIGHEMASSTARDPQFWRELAVAAREVYSGTLTYVANWDEAARLAFWDALDLVSVSFYSPLAASPTRDPGTLQSGAGRALAALEPVARRAGRAVLLAEAGYPSVGGAPVRPWEEARGPADLETQDACYRALVGAMRGRDWIAGALWWKWPSGNVGGGPGDASYTPRGKPAEAGMRASWRDSRGRPVRAPGPR